MKIFIALAGGNSERFGKEDKILENIKGKLVFEYSIELAEENKSIDEIIIIASKNNIDFLKNFYQKRNNKKKIHIEKGGDTRFESCNIAYQKAKKLNCLMLIFHNLANPLATKEELQKTIDECKKHGAAGVGKKSPNTLRKENIKTIDRNNVFLMETPQAISFDVYSEGIKKSQCKNTTDDLSIAEIAGYTPKLIPSSDFNFKITKKQDLFLMKKIMEDIRIGIGQDSHFFSEKKGLWIGGIFLENEFKLNSNSDGDVVLHSLVNAISSAASYGSIATFADELCKNGVKNSSEYVKHIIKKISPLKIKNISISIEGKNPKLEKLFVKMKNNIAKLCEIKNNQIGITATTGEGLTSFGKGEGIFCTTNVILY